MTDEAKPARTEAELTLVEEHSKWDLARLILRLEDERDAEKARADALSRWSCSSCGARFDTDPPGPNPEAQLEGVTHCSSCVELNEQKVRADHAEVNERGWIKRAREHEERIAALEPLVRQAAQDSVVTTADDPGCFYCDSVEHTDDCPAKKVLGDD